MTESQLLQLRLDVLAAAGSASKPVPHHVIGDWLSGTESRELVRYNLRVIDVLVETGELVRHINTEGGRNTYSVGRLDAGASNKRLRKLFADDLDQGAPAATPQASTPAVKPSTPGPARMPNLTHIRPSGKPEPYRPTEPVRARVLGLIDDARQCSRAYLVSRLHDTTKSSIDNALWVLCKSGLLVKIGEGEYTRPADTTAAAAGTSVAPKVVPTAAKPKPAAKARAVKESLIVAASPPVFAGPITTLDGAVTDSPARDLAPPLATGMLGVIRALQDLGATMRDHATATAPAAPPITDLPLKVATLRKLAPMVAADISAVLDAVANDLQAMGEAA